MSENETNSEAAIPEKEYTPKELEDMRKKTIEYYKAQNSVLKVQLDFETMNAEIEVQRTRRLAAIAQRYSFLAPQGPDGDEGDEGKGNPPAPGQSEVPPGTVPVAGPKPANPRQR